MTHQPPGPGAGSDTGAAEAPVCYRHPGRETWIRCQRCERPICPDCMREASVGFQCPDCIRQGARQTRQGQALYGGRRSRDPRLTSLLLIGVNAAVWLAIMATGGSGSRLVERLALSPLGRCSSGDAPGSYYPRLTSEALCQRAGDGIWSGGAADGAWWQLITSAFTHVAVWHIAANMLALFVLGPIAEQILGRARFLAVYLLAGLAGSVMVLWLSEPAGSTLGASGAIFGLLGVLLVVFRRAGADSSWLLQNLALGAVVTVIGWQFISWQGHLGGFLGGAAAAAVIAYAPRRARAGWQWGGLTLLALLLVALAVVRLATLT